MDYKGRIDGDEILKSQWLAARMELDAQQTAARARAAVSKSSGRLAASIDARVDKRGGVRRDRVVGVVTASAVRATPEPPYNYGAGQEFGNSQTRADFYLLRSLPS